MAANNNNKNLNVPSLRFPGFTEPWQTAILENIANLSKGSGISKDKLSVDGKPCILYGELYTKYTSEIISEIFSRTNTTEKNLVQSEANDVIIPASGETAIDISTARCISKSGVLLGGDLNIIRFENQNGSFFSYQLNGVRKLDIARIAQGVSVVHLYGDKLRKLRVFFPSLMEQKKIADFLTLLDERIATQRKIIEDLKYLIKGLREVIFKMPCSRYVLLGEIAELYQPKTISTAELQEDGYLVYGANGVIGHYHSYNHENPQISITCRGNTCGQVNLTSPFSWITGNAMVVNIDGNEEIDQSYLFHFLSFYNFSSIISGSGQPQIVRTPLAKIKVPYLELGDQQKISRLLSSITSRIEIEECHLNCLLLQKDYLVSVLFI